MVKSKKNGFFERDVEIGKLCSKLSLSNNGRAIIYSRVSTQTQQNGLSLKSQTEACEAYCLDRNYQIIDTINEAKSAKSISNQKNLMNILVNHENINLVIYEPSRLSRNLRDCIEFIDRCQKKHIIIHFVEKRISSESSNDLKVILNDIIDSQTEITNLSARMKRSIRYQKIHNIYFPSVSPYGTKYSGKGDMKRRIVEPFEQKVILLIKKFFFGETCIEIEKLLKEITGVSAHKIYDYTNEGLKITSIEHGNMNYKDIAEFLNWIQIFKRGKPWSSSSIKNIIKSN